MARIKSAPLNEKGIKALAKDKPVVYQIQNSKGDNIYTGVARRGRVGARLKEHLPGAKHAIRGGVKVEIRQKSSIDEALEAEASIIMYQQPPKSKRGKKGSYTRFVRAAPKTGTKGRVETKRAVGRVISSRSRKEID